MLSRIKELVSGNELKEGVKAMSESLKQTTAAVREQVEAMAALRKESEAAKASAAEMADEIKKSASYARQMQDELKTAVAEIKALSSHIQGSVKQKIGEDLMRLTEEVKAKLEGADRLKAEIASVAASVGNELNKIRADATKLSAVTATIKVEDFQLTKFSQQLAAADSEKLRLLKRIDELESIIAKMRRQPR
ncbi:hypothetical protein HYU17_01860 [Candidatus Woesearchaeota archaeon]|nr:hypothetical protein [Candidatus Woesearchaeota archaeon]